MRWLIATITAIVSLAPLAARAADLPLPALGVYAPPPAYRAVANWGGFYVGGNFDFGLARDRSNFSTGGVTFATADTALFGAVGGGQAGFNCQTGALVVGVEGDFDWSNPEGSISTQCAVCVPPATASLEHDIDWFGTARLWSRRLARLCHRRLCLRTRRAQGHRDRGRRERLAHPKRDAERLDHRWRHRTRARSELERKA